RRLRARLVARPRSLDPRSNPAPAVREAGHCLSGFTEIAPVRIAVVGLGYWGPNLVRNLHDLPCASLEAVCDVRQEALKHVGARYPGVRCVRDFEEILDDDRIEAVAIATPVGTHAELAGAALARGKHVFVEKPLAASVSDSELLIEAAEAGGLLL